MTKGKRRLIFLWPYLDWGGGQVYLLAIMKEAREDWDVTAIVPRRSSPEILRYIDEAGAKCELMDTYLDTAAGSNFWEKLRHHWRRARTESTILQVLRSYDLKNSILHIDLSPWYGWLFYPRLARRGANVFVTLHNALPPASRWHTLVWKARMQIASRLPGFHIFTSNNDTKEHFHGWVEAGFWERIRVTYTCVNPVEIEDAQTAGSSRSEIRRRFGVSNDAFVVLCVGQFIDRKGRWVFLDAAEIVARSTRDVTFVWLTPNEPTSEDLGKVESYGLGDRFRLVQSETVGNKRGDILSFYPIADIFALPSFVEGLPIALLEAMAMGVPSVSTNVNAIPEAIVAGETGMLVEPGDPQQLADAILTLKGDSALRERLAASGREHVLKNFDERVASRIAIEAYEECFADGG